MNPLVFPVPVRIAAPSSEDKTADAERVKQALKRSGYPDVAIPLRMLRELPVALRNEGSGNPVSLNPALGYTGDGFKIVRLSSRRLYGIALDIGTTTLAVSLFDMISGERVDYLDLENPQTTYGDDVLTRIHKSVAGSDLHGPLMEGVKRAITAVGRKKSLQGDDIVAVVVAGNTIMTHFFLDLPVDNIPVEPYIPVIHSPEFLTNRDMNLPVHQEALLYVYPNAGSYVGGDIVSGVVATGIYREDQPCFFIDVGTNAEIVMGCAEWLVVGAGAAGPALEGGISSIGRKAAPGTIHHVKIDRVSKEATAEVIGGGDPIGICGSGMTELVSEMFDSGIIDQRGRFAPGYTRFVIGRSAEGELAISEEEVENFVRSKAALFTSLSVLVRSVGLGFKDIRRFFVGGALGCGISVEKAKNIGMLPDIGNDRFSPVGNSSLKGAEMLLMNRDLHADITRILGMMTYRELNEDGGFMREFPGALFIPHTERGLLS